MFVPFQETLKKAIAAHGLKRILQAAEVCKHFDTLSANIFPEDEEHIIRAHAFKEKTLIVGVPDTIWANEVIIRKDLIIRQMNAAFADQVIDNIRTQLVVPEAAPPEAQAPEPQPPEATSPEDASQPPLA